MPNNIEGRGLTDREMLQRCRESEPRPAGSISNTLLESSHQELREIYQQCFDNASENQRRLYEIMNNKGWYKTVPATTEQIGIVQELMKNNLHPDDQY